MSESRITAESVAGVAQQRHVVERRCAVVLGGQIAAVRITPGAGRPGAAGLYAPGQPALIGHPGFGFERQPNRIKRSHCAFQRFDAPAERLHTSTKRLQTSIAGAQLPYDLVGVQAAPRVCLSQLLLFLLAEHPSNLTMLAPKRWLQLSSAGEALVSSWRLPRKGWIQSLKLPAAASPMTMRAWWCVDDRPPELTASFDQARAGRNGALG